MKIIRSHSTRHGILPLVTALSRKRVSNANKNSMKRFRTPHSIVIAVVMNNLGPYHHVRLESLSKKIRVIAIVQDEPGKGLAYSAWDGKRGYERIDLKLTNKQPKELRRSIHEKLSTIGPTVVAVTGWSELSSWAALEWCIKTGTPKIVMSDTQHKDRPRNYFFELLKGYLVSCFDSALVAGSPQKLYLESLGLSKEQIKIGFYAIDNDYFRKASNVARANRELVKKKYGLPKMYILCVGRLVHIKGYDLLIKALGASKNGQSFHLVIVGDGPEKINLQALARKTGVLERTHFLGKRTYREIPQIYSLAYVVAMPSRSEPWGLVANEALASGVPVFVSSNCGCGHDLLRNRRAGEILLENSLESWTKIINRLATNRKWVKTLTVNTYSTVENWGPARFTQGMLDAISASRNSISKKSHRQVFRIISFLRFFIFQFSNHLRNSLKGAKIG